MKAILCNGTQATSGRVRTRQAVVLGCKNMCIREDVTSRDATIAKDVAITRPDWDLGSHEKTSTIKQHRDRATRRG